MVLVTVCHLSDDLGKTARRKRRSVLAIIGKEGTYGMDFSQQGKDGGGREDLISELWNGDGKPDTQQYECTVQS